MKSVMFVSAAFLAGAASAQNLHIAVKVSLDGRSWSDDVGPLPGAVVQVGIWMIGDASIYGMGGGTMRLRGTELAASDEVRFAEGTSTGRVGPFNFGAATNAIFREGPSGFRIDAASDAANSSESAGLTFFQRDPATANPGTFSTQNPALCFRFDVTIGSSGPIRDITMQLDQLSQGVAGYFTAANSNRPTMAAVTFSGAVIHVWPAPGSAAAMGLFAAMSGRRRRGWSGSLSVGHRRGTCP